GAGRRQAATAERWIPACAGMTGMTGRWGSSFGLDLLRRVPAQQVAGRVVVQAVADPPQVTDQAADLAQGRTQLGEAIVGETVDGGTVLVDQAIGALGGRVQFYQRVVQAVDKGRQAL